MEVKGRRVYGNRRRKSSLKIFLISESSSSGLNAFFQPTLFESLLCAKSCMAQGIQGQFRHSPRPCVAHSPEGETDV